MRSDLVIRALNEVIPRASYRENFLKAGRVASTKPDTSNRLQSGTTVLAFPFEHGLIFAADRKTTMGYLSIIALDSVKIFEAAPHTAIGCAGLVGDIQFVENTIQEINAGFQGRFDYTLSIEGQANYLANLLRDFRFYVLPWGLEVQVLLGGYDLSGSYEIYDIECDGSKRKCDYFVIGSGTDGALNVLRESKNKIQSGKLSLEDSINLALKAIYRSGEVDNGTSDIRIACPNIATITPKGFEMIDTKVVAKAVSELLKKEDE